MRNIIYDRATYLSFLQRQLIRNRLHSLPHGNFHHLRLLLSRRDGWRLYLFFQVPLLAQLEYLAVHPNPLFILPRARSITPQNTSQRTGIIIYVERPCLLLLPLLAQLQQQVDDGFCRKRKPKQPCRSIYEIGR
jgi:hypothetical protein